MHYKAIAAYYDAEYEQQEMLRHDVPLFLAHLPKKKSSVLELAVGTGRAAIPIAQAGHLVVGVDTDPHMLARARRKRDAVGLTERQLELRRGNMIRLRLGRTFDYAAIFFNTFMLCARLKDQDQALGAIRRHLKRGGRLWLDVYQPNLQILGRPHTRNIEPHLFYVPELDRTVYRCTEIRCDPTTQIQRVTFHYTWFDQAGREHHEKVEFDLTFMFPRELRLLLERNGFAIEHLYGDHDGSDLTADSPRMIACCTVG
jgi:SAM-dependent methyltransferase